MPLAVPASVVDELDRLVDQGLPGARAARALAARYATVPCAGRGDSGVLDAALRHRGWVVTADRALAERLRREGVTVLVPRDRHRLEVHRGRPTASRTARGSRRPESIARRQRL